LLSHAGARCVILLIHHHIGFPPEKLREFRERYGQMQTDALTLLDAEELKEIILPLRHCYVFHGHKHFPYHARLGEAIVISGPSVTYGPHEGGDSCALYQLNQDQSLRFVASPNVSTDRRRQRRAATHTVNRPPTLPATPPWRAESGPFGRAVAIQFTIGLAVLFLAASILVGYDWRGPRMDGAFARDPYRYLESFWDTLLTAAGVGGGAALVPICNAAAFLGFLALTPAEPWPRMMTPRSKAIFYFNMIATVVLWITIYGLSALRVPKDAQPPSTYFLWFLLLPMAGVWVTVKRSAEAVFSRIITVIALGVIAGLVWLFDLLPVMPP
jgi:hypothetical protein